MPGVPCIARAGYGTHRPARLEPPVRLRCPARRGEEAMRHVRDLSRREFLVRAGGTAAAIPTMSAILDACSKPGASTSGSSAFEIATPDHPATLPMNAEPIATDTPIEQGATLQILNWAV